MADAKKCDISGRLYDIIDESKREFHIYRKPPGKGKHRKLLEICPEKYEEILKALKSDTGTIKIDKPAKKRSYKRKKKKVVKRKKAKTTTTKPAKETYILPKKKQQERKGYDQSRKRLKAVHKRANDLKAEGMDWKKAFRQANDEWKKGTINGWGKAKANVNGSSKCQSCSEPIPMGDKYCPTCNMVHGSGEMTA